jgi:hypothetical protein
MKMTYNGRQPQNIESGMIQKPLRWLENFELKLWGQKM